MVNQVKEILQQILGELKNVNTRLDGVESCLGSVESHLDGVESRLDGVESGQKEIYQVVRALEVRTDEHGALLNRIIEDMDHMKGDLKSRQEGQVSLDGKLDDLGVSQRYAMQKIAQHDVDIFKLKEAVIKHVSGL